MYKNILQSISGIEIYPLISFAIFFAFFLGLLLYVILVDKNLVKTMSELPLSQDEPFNETPRLNR
jgi:amino acid permease